MSEQVILVDQNDTQIGVMDKLEAHQKNCLHRAFSILLWNDQHEMLIHQRAEGKYHSAGLWTKTCCSHPRPNETIQDAATRRLKEEMGIETPLKSTFYFIYQVDLEDGLSEYELDHVFIGKFNDEPQLNPEEAQAYRWIGLSQLKQEIAEQPTKFTYWFKYILTHFEHKISLDSYESL